jgi:hypothetical protein
MIAAFAVHHPPVICGQLPAMSLRLAPPIKWKQALSRERREKKNRYWLLPVHRTGVPGGGRAGSENLPTHKMETSRSQ